MDYRTIVENAESIKKLTSTNALPWTAALEFADFANEVEKTLRAYNKAFNAIQFEIGIIDSSEQNDVPKLMRREEMVDALLSSELQHEITVPTLTQENVKKLYETKSEKDDEPSFNISDIKAFKQLGILE